MSDNAEAERDRWQKEAEGWLDALTAAEAVVEGLRAELAEMTAEYTKLGVGYADVCASRRDVRAELAEAQRRMLSDAAEATRYGQRFREERSRRAAAESKLAASELLRAAGGQHTSATGSAGSSGAEAEPSDAPEFTAREIGLMELGMSELRRQRGDVPWDPEHAAEMRALQLRLQGWQATAAVLGEPNG